jgi:hypothetical protein
MPILVMAMLALTVFGLIGIMLVVAVLMEHSEPAGPARRKVSQAVTSDVTPFLNPSFDRPRGEDAPTENPSEKEKVHEHACTG